MLNTNDIPFLLDQLDTKPRSILVFGDAMLDTYIYGSAHRLSPEAPVPILVKEKEHVSLGGAANVAFNLSCLQEHSSLCSLAGEDSLCETLLYLLDEHCIKRHLIFQEPTRKTTHKTRFFANNPHQLLRLDDENTHEPDDSTKNLMEDRILKELDLVDGVIVADYLKGCVYPELLTSIIEKAQLRNIPTFIDLKHDQYQRYSGATLLKPNRTEFERLFGFAFNLLDPKLPERVRKIKTELNVPYLVVTLGGDGMVVSDEHHDLIHIQTRAKNVFDVTGAGDVVLAWLAYGLIRKLPIFETCFLANAAGTLSVSRLGTTAISREDLLHHE